MNKYTLRRSPLAITIGSILAAGPAHAAIITVTTAADGPIGSVEGCSLREAVASANESNSQGGCQSGSILADTIVFDPELAGSTITLNQGEIEITESLILEGPVPGDPSGLTIDANGRSRIFSVVGPAFPSDHYAEFRNLTLTGGRKSATGQPAYAGAVVAQYASLGLRNALVTGNTVTSVTVGGDGALALAGGLLIAGGDLVLENSTLSDNLAFAGARGAESHAQARGGGAWVVGGEVRITDSVVSGNRTVAEGSGENTTAAVVGGLIISAGELTMENSSVTGNAAYAWADDEHAETLVIGGGLTLHRSEASIRGSAISGNSAVAKDAATGAGLYLIGAHASLENSTISGNSVDGTRASGGGVAVVGVEFPGGYSYGASLTLSHGTVAFNSVDGVYATDNGLAELVLNNSLIVQGDSSETACSGAAATGVNSLATDASCTGTATGLAQIRLGPLVDNGGRTRTHALLPGSSAIDGAPRCGDEVFTDQRGRPRPGTGSSFCDIGAFEAQSDDDLDSIFSDRFQSRPLAESLQKESNQ